MRSKSQWDPEVIKLKRHRYTSTWAVAGLLLCAVIAQWQFAASAYIGWMWAVNLNLYLKYYLQQTSFKVQLEIDRIPVNFDSCLKFERHKRENLVFSSQFHCLGQFTRIIFQFLPLWKRLDSYLCLRSFDHSISSKSSHTHFPTR